jgi:hypothetical protein
MGQLDQTPDALSPQGRTGTEQAPYASPTLERVVQGAHHTIDRLAERAVPQVQRMHDGAERARQVGDEWVEDLRGTVRDRPLASLAAALALGMVISRLIR